MMVVLGAFVYITIGLLIAVRNRCLHRNDPGYLSDSKLYIVVEYVFVMLFWAPIYFVAVLCSMFFVIYHLLAGK